MTEKMKPRLEDVYDLDDMTCEKHPGRKWPHPWLLGTCIGPGIPKLKQSDKSNE